MIGRTVAQAQAAGALNHPNIVTIYEFGEHDGRLYLAMELIDGDLLRDLVGDRPMPLERALDIAIQIAEGLGKAHANDIAHRDIKPENVLIDEDGRARILDFGLAKPQGATQLTREGSTVGTIHYMSPEQARQSDVDRRTDIWSLGVLLYEMLTGEVPFHGDHEQATLYSIINEPHQPLTERRTHIPLGLERTVDKMLSKKPEERYHSAEDLLVDLRTLRGSVTSAGTSHTAGLHVGARNRRRGVRVLLTALVAAIAIVAIGLWLGRRDGDVTVAKSIAVLPFANMSDEKENEYFSDGLSEELLNALARVGDLHVAARTSSWQFKGRSGDVEDIGRQLNVSTVLEGSVRRAGNRVRVTVQLIDANNGFHMWSQTYDRELGDIFAIQEDISNRVIDALKVTLLESEGEQLARQPTDNLEAYDSYLLGKHQMAQRTVPNLEEAVRRFESAIDLDPDFALAHVGLADAILLLGSYGTIPMEGNVERIERHLNRALELDSTLGEAYASLAFFYGQTDRTPEAHAAFERAIELSPSYATAYHWYGLMLGGFRAYPQKATAMLKKAVELDPLSPIINMAYAGDLRDNGRFDEAIARLERVISLDSDFPNVYVGMAEIFYEEYGKSDEALEWLGKAIALDPDNLRRRFRRAHYLAGAGRIDKAQAECAAIIDADPDHAWGYTLAGDLYRQMGRPLQAVRSYREGAIRDKENPWAQALWVSALLDLGDVDAAEAWLERLPPMQTMMLQSFIFYYRSDFAHSEETLNQLAAAVGVDYFREPLSDFDLRAGRYAQVRDRYATAFPEIFDNADPRIHSGNLEQAVLIAAALIGLGEDGRAQRLLQKCAAYVESLPETQRRFEHAKRTIEIYALQGRTREALAELEWGVDFGLRKEWWLIPGTRTLRSIRDEPAFTAAFEKLRGDMAALREQLTDSERMPP